MQSCLRRVRIIRKLETKAEKKSSKVDVKATTRNQRNFEISKMLIFDLISFLAKRDDVIIDKREKGKREQISLNVCEKFAVAL